MFLAISPLLRECERPAADAAFRDAGCHRHAWSIVGPGSRIARPVLGPLRAALAAIRWSESSHVS